MNYNESRQKRRTEVGARLNGYGCDWMTAMVMPVRLDVRNNNN